jgi:hypothetical protein
MMVPVPNHIEQMINAYDGELSGAGISAQTFDLDVFKGYLPEHPERAEAFQAWCGQSRYLMSRHLSDLLHTEEAKESEIFRGKLAY